MRKAAFFILHPVLLPDLKPDMRYFFLPAHPNDTACEKIIHPLASTYRLSINRLVVWHQRLLLHEIIVTNHKTFTMHNIDRTTSEYEFNKFEFEERR